MEVIGFPNGSGIRLLGKKLLKLPEAKLETLVNPAAILDSALQEDAITVRRLVISIGIKLGAQAIFSDTFGARHIDDEVVYDRVIDGQVSIVRSTLDELALKGLLYDPVQAIGGAWFGPYKDCYRFNPQESDFEKMFQLHLRQAKAAERNKVEPQFEAVSSVRQAQTIAMACRELGIVSPSINFVVSHEGKLPADGASFKEGVAAIRDILPQAKIGLNCCRVVGAENTGIDKLGLHGSFYPNASQLEDAWELEGEAEPHNDIDASLAGKIVDFAARNGFKRVGICCGADEESLGHIIAANQKLIEETIKNSRRQP